MISTSATLLTLDGAELVAEVCQKVEELSVDVQAFTLANQHWNIIICKETPAVRELLIPHLLSSVAREPGRAPTASQACPTAAPPLPRRDPPAAPVGSSQDYGSDVNIDELALVEAPAPANPLAATAARTLALMQEGALQYSVSSKNKKFQEKLRQARDARREALERMQAAQKGERRPPLRRIIADSSDESEHEGRWHVNKRQRQEEDEDEEDEDEDEEDEEEEEEEELSSLRCTDDEREVSAEIRWMDQKTAELGLKQARKESQAKILHKARQVAGPAAAEEWRGLLEMWRQKGTLLSTPAGAVQRERQAPLEMQGLPREIQEFYLAYRDVEEDDLGDAWRAIHERLRYVHLWRLICMAEDKVLMTWCIGPSRGQTPRSRQRIYLFSILHPTLADHTHPHQSKSPKTRRAFQQFRARIRAGERFHTIQGELGHGMLALMPHRQVENSWVAKKVNLDEFRLFVETVKHFNPQAVRMARLWDYHLSKATQGPVAVDEVCGETRAVPLKPRFSAFLQSLGLTGSMTGADIQRFEQEDSSQPLNLRTMGWEGFEMAGASNAHG